MQRQLCLTHLEENHIYCHHLFSVLDIRNKSISLDSSTQQRSRSNLSTHCYLMSKSIMSNIVIGQFQNYKYWMWLQNLEVV